MLLIPEVYSNNLKYRDLSVSIDIIANKESCLRFAKVIVFLKLGLNYYGYIDNFERFSVTQLPPKDQF